MFSFATLVIGGIVIYIYYQPEQLQISAMKSIPCVLLLLFYFKASAQQRNISVSPEPVWISKVAQPSVEPETTEAEDGYLYLGYESQLSVPEQSKFFKKRLRILSEAGLQNASEVSINFDPTYQKLVFHTLRIIRGAQTINRLEPKKIRLIQQETDLSKHLYDGSLTAYISVEGSQVNDVIEYSYSLQGFNPLFNKVATAFDLQFSVPVGYLLFKVIMPYGRAIQIKNIQSSIKPAVTQSGSSTKYEWFSKNISALHLPNNLPALENHYPKVLISEYNTWKDVVD